MSGSRKRLFTLISLAVIISGFFLSFSSNELTEKKPIELTEGKLNIQHDKLEEIGPIKLDGEWQFYWGEILTPIELTSNKLNPIIVNVPDNWNNYGLGKDTVQYGYATYRLTIKVNEADVGNVVSIYMPSVATAYNLLVNGQHLASNGIIGKTQEEMIPKEYPQTVTFEMNQAELDIIIHVSNYHQRKSGIWDSITIGTVDQINMLTGKNILTQSFVIGCIFIIGFYHLVIYYHRKQDLSALFLAITCFAVALRTMLLKETLFIKLVPEMNWEIALTLEYVSSLASLLFFLLFVKREIAFEKINKINNIFVIILFSYIIFVIVTPARIFTNTFSFYQILATAIMLTIITISIYGVKQKYESAYLNIIGLVVLFIAVVNDLLYYSNKIPTDEFVSIGLLFYLFTQSVHLARKSSKSYDRVEKLSNELQELNLLLESKVKKRTKELQVANEALHKIEKARRRLLASVSHELNTPLTFIHGYIRAMMDGVVSKDDSPYLRAVYSDTQMMAHMIADLQELSKLESGQIYFHLQDINIIVFLSQLYEEQKPLFKEKNLKLSYKEHILLQTEKPVICSIDIIRIKQVFNNLIVNAQKFTPDGGIITIEVEIPSKEDDKEIKVNIIDTGIGIDKEDLQFIFERFYKVNGKQYHSDRGSGLGLAICKEIIENHGGKIGVASQIKEGSTFFFTLPIKES